MFQSAVERKEAEEWFKKHGDLVPDMSQGERVNGDPVLYFGELFDKKLFRLWIQQLEMKEGIHIDPDRQLAMSALAAKAVMESQLTGSQAMVLFLRLAGMTQDRIATALDTSKQSVSEMERKAKVKLRQAVNR